MNGQTSGTIDQAESLFPLLIADHGAHGLHGRADHGVHAVCHVAEALKRAHAQEQGQERARIVPAIKPLKHKLKATLKAKAVIQALAVLWELYA